jgi:hypothetical protein
MTKTKKEKKDATTIKCPFCGKLLLDLESEDSYCGICEHVILTYSVSNSVFGELNGEGYAICRRDGSKGRRESQARRKDSDYEEILIEDLIRALAYDFDSKYQLIEVFNGWSFLRTRQPRRSCS